MRDTLRFDSERVGAFCRQWRITELALFGSAIREDFGPDSDVDVLVTFAEDADFTLLDMVRMQAELQQIFARPVDLVSRKALTRSRNWLRRDAILSSARTVYAA
jgi:hypothetical protein